MGITSYIHESNCFISPVKLFDALFVDHDLFAKLLPDVFRSIDIIEGDGGAGTIKLLSFSEIGDFKDLKHVKQRIEILDKENFYCKYTTFQSDIFPDGLEKVVVEVKLEDSGNGGCSCKQVRHYHHKDGVEMNEEEIKAFKSKFVALYKVVEAYLTETMTPKFSVSFFLPQ